MFLSSLKTLEQFKEVLGALSEDVYVTPCEALSNATIGQHTRHIIELYQCLICGYDCSDINYDKRERNKRIENETAFAIAQITEIQEKLEKPNKEVTVTYELDGGENVLQSNYYREVMYNLEHMIHHQALIKVGFNELDTMVLPEGFGVAPSTMEYRKQCVR